MNKRAWIGLAVGLACLSGMAQAAEDGAGLSVSRMKPLSGGVSQEAYALTDDIAVAEAQVKANPNDPEAHFLLAIAYSRTPYVEKALVELDKSRRLARKSKEGFALFDRKITEYEHMLKNEPDSALVLYRLGFGYYMRGYAIDYGYMKDASHQPGEFYDKAEQTFRHLVAIAPEDISAKNYLGYLLAEREPEKNFDAAVTLWRESIRLDAGNPAAYMLLGQAAMKKGNLRQAVEYSTMALKARNAWLEAHNINPANLKIRL